MQEWSMGAEKTSKKIRQSKKTLNKVRTLVNSNNGSLIGQMNHININY